MGDPNATYKTIAEIRVLSSKLTPSQQAQVLNTLNALLFSQQVNGEYRTQPRQPPKNP